VSSADEEAANDARILARMHDDVRDYGWHIIRIPEDATGPGFAFSVGLLTTLGLPEVIVFGLPTGLMHRMLNGLGDQLRAGARFETGAPIPDLLEGAVCQLHPVHPSQLPEYFGSAIWFHQRRDFPALQLIWPGKQDGIFPWQPGADDGVRTRQPDLRQLR